MPLLAEKSLPVASPELPSAAENLAEDKLSALESFLESLNLQDSLASLGEGAFALAASFLAALGIDLDFDTPLKPAGTEQASVHFRRVPKDEIGDCAAAPEAPVKSTDDMDTALNKTADDAEEQNPVKDAHDEYMDEELYTCDDLDNSVEALLRELKEEEAAYERFLLRFEPNNSRIEEVEHSIRAIKRHIRLIQDAQEQRGC